MKKFIAMMLCIVLVLSLVACGKDAEEPTETTTEPTTETTEPTTEPTTEELTEEITEEFIEDVTDEATLDADTLALLENPGFEFVELGADGIQFEPVEPTEDMLLLKDLHMSIPVEQRFTSFISTTVLPENYEWEMYFPYSEGFTATSCNSFNMTEAHFVYLIQAPEGTDIEALCEEMESKVDVRRNICSEIQAFDTAVSGNTILFVMSQNPDSVASLIDSFNTMMAG